MTLAARCSSVDWKSIIRLCTGLTYQTRRSRDEQAYVERSYFISLQTIEHNVLLQPVSQCLQADSSFFGLVLWENDRPILSVCMQTKSPMNYSQWGGWRISQRIRKIKANQEFDGSWNRSKEWRMKWTDRRRGYFFYFSAYEKPKWEKGREISRTGFRTTLSSGASVIRSFDTFSKKPTDGSEWGWWRAKSNLESSLLLQLSDVIRLPKHSERYSLLLLYYY